MTEGWKYSCYEYALFRQLIQIAPDLGGILTEHLQTQVALGFSDIGEWIGP